MSKKRKYIIYSIILLLVVSLSVGFSAFQKQLLIDDSIFHVRLHEDVRVSDIKVQSSSENVVSNYEDFNVSKLYGSVNFPSANSYILYKLDLSNYGNLKSGLFSVTNNESGTSVQLCNSNGGSCTSNFKTPVCNGNDCTLGATKEIYVKVTSSSSGNKMIDIDFDFEPYNNITYTNFREDTSSFQTDIMSHDSYQITLTSKPEEVSITGYVTYTYNKNTGVLSISDVSSNINIHAKYLINKIAEENYEENNPNNYVSFDNSLYRIITKESIDDGYGNEELRTKIVKHESIGNNIFGENTSTYCDSSLAAYLNNTYYEGLNSSSKELIDYALWISDIDNNSGGATDSYSSNQNNYKVTKMASYFPGNSNEKNGCVANIGLINENDFSNNSHWLTYDEYTIGNEKDSSSGGTITKGKIKEKYEVTPLDTKKVVSTKTLKAVVSGELSDVLSDTSLPTHPVAYLKSEVLIVGGSGTSTNPYILELPSNSTQSNPTIVTGINQYVTGSNMDLVTLTNKVGTVYYSIEEELNANNYTEGGTTIPKEKNAREYWISYYIPAGNGYKAKKGYVISHINPYTFYITYEKGAHIHEIYSESDRCTTVDSNITCNVSLPVIVPDEYYDSVGWSTTNGDTTGLAPGTNYTLSSDNNNIVLYANAVIQKNYQNTSNNRYYTTLKDAIDDVSSGQTIKVLNSVRELEDITLSESKTNVLIDLNGQTISLYSASITNNGTLDIYNSSSTDGIIQQTYFYHDLIINNGTLSINKTSTTNKTYLTFTGDFNGQTLVLNNENKIFNIYTNAILSSYSSSESCVKNHGTTNMYGGTLRGLGVFSNSTSGTFNMSGGSINDVYSNAISNSGTVNISGGTINSSGIGINNSSSGNVTINGNVHITTSTNPAYSEQQNGIVNSGQLSISAGSIEGYYTIKNTSTGDAEITGTAQITSSYYGITNNGTLRVTGGNISGVNRGIHNENNLTISGSNTVISATSSSGIAVNNFGGITTMSNGTINSAGTGISNSSRKLTITGGTINADGSGIINKNSGSVNIEGGVVNSLTAGIYSNSGYVTIGVNDSTVNTNSPLIQTTGTDNKYGLNSSGSTTYFYDGIIKSASGLNHSILGNSINIPENYEIQKDLDNGIESAYLKKIPYLMAGANTAEDANYLRTNIAKQDIETITFTNSISGHTVNGTDCFDVSLDSDGTVLAWVTDTDSNGKYEITIGADNKVYVSSGEFLFSRLINLTNINGIQYLDTSKATTLRAMFNYCNSLLSIDVSNFVTSNVTSFSAMFYECSSLTSIDVSRFDTTKGTNMSAMFSGCSKLTSLNLTSFDTSKVTTMNGMFYKCIKLSSLDLSNFNTSNVTNMSNMFSSTDDAGPMVLTQIIGIENFNTSNVTRMNTMFQHCAYLTNLDLSGWNTSKVINMSYMFYGCKRLTSLNVSHFDTSIVTNMKCMFYDCATLIELDISSFSTPLVTDMSYMFNRLWAIRTIYASDNFVTTSVTTSTYMFLHDDYLVGGSGTVFGGSGKSNAVYAHIDGGESNPGYFTDKNALKATFYYNSNITAGGLTVGTKIATCVPAEGQTSCTVTIPNSVTSSVGKYNSPYKGVSSSTSSMSTTSNLTINSNTTYYAVYSGQVTRYYYNNGYTSNTIYRNEFLTSNSEMSSVLSTSNTGTTNYTTSNGPGSSTFVGLSSAQDTTAEYNSVSEAANSADTTLYTVYQFSVSYEIGANVSSVGSTSSTCNITTSDTSCSVILPSITPDSGYTSVGWSSTNGDATGTSELTLYMLNTNNTVLYANAIIANYLNTTTNKVYTTLVSAFNDVANNQTIQVIGDNVRETDSSTNASDKTGIKFDLNGKTIRLNKIINSGELDIYNSSSSPATISYGVYNMLDNSGTLTLNGTTHNNSININITNASSCNYIINNTQNFVLNDNVAISLTGNDVSCGIIYNSGLFTMNGGTITGSTSGIQNHTSGTINMNNGTISVSGNKVGVSNNGTLNVSGGTINAYIGVSSTVSGSNPIVRVTGGSITGSANGISIGSTTTLTVGTNDGNVNVNSPIIVSNNHQSNYYYGVNADSNSTFNFYDGTIKSASGSGFAINKDPDNIETGYQVHKEIISNYEQAFLIKPAYLMQSDNQGPESNYLRTNIAKQDIETITFVNSIAGHTANGTDCFDVSRDEDGSVLAWASDSDSDGLYELTIGAYGNIHANYTDYMFYMLFYLESINGMQYLDTSQATNMEYMFSWCARLNSLDLSHFDTSNVTNMNHMFYSNVLTQIDVGNFNTLKVTDMSYMFAGWDDFMIEIERIDGLNSWDTSNVTDVSSMFQYCHKLKTLDLSHFNTSKVTNMSYMFDGCQEIISLNLSSFNTSQVTNMTCMFSSCYDLTSLNLSNFDTSKVTSMISMFAMCYALNSLNIDSFNTSNVTDMTGMFSNCDNLISLDLSHFDTSKVTNMSSMFTSCYGLISLNLSSFDTSRVTNTRYMFSSSNSLKTIYASNSFVTTNITTSTDMFRNCTSLVGMMGTTYNSSRLTAAYAHIDGGTSNPGYFTKIGGTLAQGNSGSTTFFNSSPINKSDVETITFQKTLGAPSGSLGSWDASLDLDNSVIAYYTDTDSNGKYEVTIASDGIIVAPQDSSYLFAKFANLTSFINLTYLNTSNVTNMSSMFASCKSLTTLDLSSFDTSKVTNMAGMFQIYTESFGSFTSNLAAITGLNQFNTSNVTNMNSMFKGLLNLTSIDVSSFDTSKVTNMSSMFSNCTSLTVIDVSNFNTSNVTNMSFMFSGDKYIYGAPENYIMSLNSIVGIENFDTSKVTDMQCMFQCTKLITLNLSGWDTSKVTEMIFMFRGSNLLNTVSVSNNFVTTNVTNSINMFTDCTSLVGGSGTVYDSSHVDVTYAHIDEGTSNPGYFTQAPESIGVNVFNGANSLLNSINKEN